MGCPAPTDFLREPQPFFHVCAALVLAPCERVSPRQMPERLASLRRAAEAGRELQLLGCSRVRGGDLPRRQLDAEATCERHVELTERSVGAGVVLGRDDHLPRPLEKAAVVERLDEREPGIAVGVHRGLTVACLRELAEELLSLNEL